MAWFASQLILLLVVSFLLGLLLGYLVWIWGWRKRVEDSVEVTTTRRETAATPGGAPVETEAAIADRDARIAELEDRLRRRVAEVEVERDRRIAALEADRDQRVAALEAERDQTIEEREATVAQLVADRNRRIAAALAERDELRRRLDQHDTGSDEGPDERVAGLEARVADMRSALEPDDDVAVITVVDDGDDSDGSPRGFADAITARSSDQGRAPSGVDTTPSRTALSDRIRRESSQQQTVDLEAAEAPDTSDVAEPSRVGEGQAAAVADVPATPVEPDDLTRVEGIGPKMQGALHDAGVLTFGQLAATTEHDIRAAIVAAGMRFAPSVPTWAKQASYLVDGDEEGLAVYQDSLVAGREAGPQ